VTARFAALPTIMAWIERSADSGGLDSDQSKRMQLAAEELFVNSIHHGYGGECDAGIELALDIDAVRATLTFIDHAPPFNMNDAAPLTASAERIGGVGLNLVRALANAIRYRRESNSNVTILDFPPPTQHRNIQAI